MEFRCRTAILYLDRWTILEQNQVTMVSCEAQLRNLRLLDISSNNWNLIAKEVENRTCSQDRTRDVAVKVVPWYRLHGQKWPIQTAGSACTFFSQSIRFSDALSSRSGTNSVLRMDVLLLILQSATWLKSAHVRGDWACASKKSDFSFGQVNVYRVKSLEHMTSSRNISMQWSGIFWISRAIEEGCGSWPRCRYQ